MPDVSWNSAMWGGRHDWPSRGEEWSEPWGGAEPQWFGSIYPRIHRFLPAQTVLEIAPGYGRWSRYLVPQCSQYLGIDLSAEAIESCKSSFSYFEHARFYQNDGMSLQLASDGEFDLVFSFDSLVHVELDVMNTYMVQSLRKLRPTGVGFFHHSNTLEYADVLPDPAPGFRARSVSAEKIAAIVNANGGRILVQEKINWGNGPEVADCITLFARGDYPADIEPKFLRNHDFGSECRLIKAYQAPYSYAGQSR